MLVNVVCYARALSDSPEDVENADVRAFNMRDQVSALVKLYTAEVPGAYHMIPLYSVPLRETGVFPYLAVFILVVEFSYDESAAGAI
jgi:hypothetical protein